MASKTRDMLSKSEVISVGVAGVATFDKGVPGGPFKCFSFKVVGTDNSLAGAAPTSYVVKRRSTEIWNLTPAQFRAFLEATISPIGGSVPATSALRYTMPFDMYMKEGIMGLPSDAYTVEINYDADADAGSIKMSWEFADAEPGFYLRMVRESMQIPVSQASYPYYIKTRAGIPVMGFILPLVSATEGIQELWLYRAPKDGAPAEELWHGEYLDILESQAHYNPEAITNPFMWKPFKAPVDYPDGSYIKVKSGTSTVEADEIVPVQIVPANMTV